MQKLPESSRGEALWGRILRAALALPGAKVDRASFLRSQLSNYCDEDQVREAIDTTPALASIPSDLIDSLADSCITSHVFKASTLSFAAGLPGGWAMAGTIPADLAQFHWHALVLSQKLAYLYGWPDLLEQGKVDDETELQLTLFVGAMMGAAKAKQGLAELARRVAAEVEHRIAKQALTRYPVYNVSKQVAKWIGIKLTKQSFARVASKAVPIVGGVVSASVTAVLMRTMARRLKNHLRKLRYALPE